MEPQGDGTHGFLTGAGVVGSATTAGCASSKKLPLIKDTTIKEIDER